MQMDFTQDIQKDYVNAKCITCSKEHEFDMKEYYFICWGNIAATSTNNMNQVFIPMQELHITAK